MLEPALIANFQLLAAKTLVANAGGKVRAFSAKVAGTLPPCRRWIQPGFGRRESVKSRHKRLPDGLCNSRGVATRRLGMPARRSPLLAKQNRQRQGEPGQRRGAAG